MTALLWLRSHWRVIAVVAALGGAYGAGRIHQGWKEGAARERAVAAVLAAKEREAAENRKRSAALNDALALKEMENEKLRRQVRAALDSPDAVVYGPDALCLLARARNYPCQPAGSVSGEMPGSASQPVRRGPHGSGRNNGGGSP